MKMSQIVMSYFSSVDIHSTGWVKNACEGEIDRILIYSVCSRMFRETILWFFLLKYLSDRAGREATECIDIEGPPLPQSTLGVTFRVLKNLILSLFMIILTIFTILQSK